MRTLSLLILLLGAVGWSGAALAAGGGTAQKGEMVVGGVFGIRPATAASAVAAWVEIPAGMSLAGIRWYNNDGTVVFPALYAAAPAAAGPPPLATASLCATGLQGVSSGWSTADFERPVGSDGGGVYVVLQIPMGSVQEAVGAGGGAGIGFTADGNGCPGWITADGEDWTALAAAYRLAMEPVLVPAGGELVVTSKALPPAEPEPAAAAGRHETALLAPAPNPFNPQTVIRFSLARDGVVDLAVYDLQGRRVRTVASGSYSAGSHAVVWQGEDGQGRRLPSGVYFARLEADGQILTRRIALVK